MGFSGPRQHLSCLRNQLPLDSRLRHRLPYSAIFTPEAMQYVDTAAYPLDRLGSQEYTQLVSRCRQDLQEHGVCRLENFVTPEGITTMQDEAGDASLEAKGNQVGRSVNAWYSSGDDTLHGTHPKNKFFDRNFGVIRDDHIRDDHAVRLVYNEPNLLRFAADVLEEPVLWQSRDA